MLETVENPNRLIKVVTLNPFKRGAVMFYARYVYQQLYLIQHFCLHSQHFSFALATTVDYTVYSVLFYCIRWVALNIVCSEYMDHIKATQKELYSYIREAPSYAQAKKDIGDLAKKFLV